jgi:3-hydroxybutyryl-CoA dehydrogenase
MPRMPLVEVIAGRLTDADTIRIAVETVTRWGKTPVRAPDTPGFIVNRILDAIKRESLALLDEGVPPAEIDRAVRLGLNFPMGPFELMDLIGLNTTLDCMAAQAKGMGRPAKFSPKIEELVAQRHWGRKTGRGFYTYPPNP